MKSLQESLLDDDDKLFKDTGDIVLIEKFLDDNYQLMGGKYIIRDSIVNCTGAITIKNEISHLTNDLFAFGKVGSFYCQWNNNLKDLKGAPKETGCFVIDGCYNLKSLEYGPEKATMVSCSECKNLISLKGSPEYIEGGFSCENCNKLKSFEGGPKYVAGCFNASVLKGLKSLKGSPKTVGLTYNISYCNNIDLVKELQYLPKFAKNLYLPTCNDVDKVIDYINKNIKVGESVYIGDLPVMINKKWVK